MKIIRSLLMFPIVIAALYSCANAQDWRKITPLISTRAEVESLLGRAEGAFGVVYQLKEGSLFIEYSSGPCRPERKSGWNVPENVVVSVSFSPKHKRRIAGLKLDPKKFRKVIDQHVGGVIRYVNDDDGITYEVQSGNVDAVEYGPAKRYDHLYCGDTPEDKNFRFGPVTADDSNAGHGSVKFDEYALKTFKEASPRLDQFATTLAGWVGARGYIIVYPGGSVTLAQAELYAVQAKKYLVKNRALGSDRIVTVIGGLRDEPSVALFITVKDGNPPIPSPPSRQGKLQ